MKTIELADDVIAGSTAFAGLIIVYVGSVTSAYSTYTKQEQRSVRSLFRRKATIGCIGVAVAAISAASALLGKWSSCNGLVGFGAILMIVTLLWGVWTAVDAVRGIK